MDSGQQMDLGKHGLHPGDAFKSNMEPCQQIKWAGNWYRRNVRLGVNWARYSLGYKQGVLSNLGNSLPLIL